MTRTRAFLCALLVALSVVAVAPAAAQEDFVTLEVTVETPGGDPVRGATITATWDGGSTSATTVSDGRALFDVPDDADVELSVEHDDYVRNFPLTVEDASNRGVSMTVHEKATARVVVEDGDGPVANADVTLRKGGRDVVQAQTDDDGVVTSGTIEAGTYSVRAVKAGYFYDRETIRVEGDVETTMSLTRGTVTLEVNVTDDHFEPPRPVGEATVEVRGSGSVTTQPGGIGRISVPVNAWTTVRVTKEGYRTTEQNVHVEEEDETVALSIERTPSISVDLLSKRVVAGESVSLVVTDEYGDPVEGATVRLEGEQVGQTDANGEAVIQVAETGNQTVTVSAESLEATAYVVGVGEGGATPAGDGETAGTTETSAETPGFGVGAALLALGLAALVAVARRRGRR